MIVEVKLYNKALGVVEWNSEKSKHSFCRFLQEGQL